MKVKADLFCADLPTPPRTGNGLVLVSGASGYIGGRLVPELPPRGYRVRAMVRRHAEDFRDRWPGVDVRVADVLDMDSLHGAMENVHTAYYLVHSMLLGHKKFMEADIRGAANFREAARAAGVKRIIYLGGLGDVRSSLSDHLRSRMEVALELQRGPVPVTVLRAAVIIGSGSASYDIIKSLVKRFPVIICPRWARTNCQPIAVRDVVKYLVGVMEREETAGQSYDIGGNEILSYQQMMEIMAEIMAKKRLFIRVPLSLTRFFSWFFGLFTPVPAGIIRCLMGGCHNEVVCRNKDIATILPFEPLTYREAVLRAMEREQTLQLKR